MRISSIKNLFDECLRRKVFRTAGYYIFACWLLIQIAELTFDAWELSRQALQFVITVMAFGFPVALVVAWRYVYTNYRLERTPSRSPDEPSDRSLRPPDIAALLVLLVVVATIIFYGVKRTQDTEIAENLRELRLTASEVEVCNEWVALVEENESPTLAADNAKSLKDAYEKSALPKDSDYNWRDSILVVRSPEQQNMWWLVVDAGRGHASESEVSKLINDVYEFVANESDSVAKRALSDGLGMWVETTKPRLYSLAKFEETHGIPLNSHLCVQ